jgi:hypothetical protein
MLLCRNSDFKKFHQCLDFHCVTALRIEYNPARFIPTEKHSNTTIRQYSNVNLLLFKNQTYLDKNYWQN